MKDKTFKAFVYGYRNVNNGKMYIGYRGTSNINDGYIFSSEDKELREAWSLGHLHRSILYRGSKPDAITHERKLLKHADARRTDNFYNKSNGGGEGIYDYREISDEMAKVGIDWIKGIDPVEEVDMYDFFDKELVKGILNKVKNGEYETFEEPIEKVKGFDLNQVRLKLLNHNHVRQISEKMKHDPKEARKNVSPIIVCVRKDGTLLIIDGNHTFAAAKLAGWTSVPVIYINSSEFLDNKSNIDHFGVIANYNPKLKLQNSSKDCQRAIINLYVDNLEKKDKNFELLDGVKFKETVENKLYPEWTKSQISGNLRSARKMIKNNYAEAQMNFQTYSKTHLDRMARKVEEVHPDVAVINISSGTVYNSGIGAILNKMGKITKKGLIIIHHNDIEEYNSWSKSLTKFKDTFLHIADSTTISYVILDCFGSTKNIEDYTWIIGNK